MAMIFNGKNRVTQAFGSGHGGIDIVGDTNGAIHAVASGTVEICNKWNGKKTTGDTNSYGNLVVIKDKAGRRYFYAHLKDMSVTVGEAVTRGDVIGHMGATGNVTGPHVHFEMRTGKTSATRINPAAYCGVDNKTGVYEEKIVVAPAAEHIVAVTKPVDNTIKINDTVKFKGGKFYISSTGGRACIGKAGRAKVTRIAKNTRYPYHIIHTDGASTVYGWVAASLISK